MPAQPSPRWYNPRTQRVRQIATWILFAALLCLSGCPPAPLQSETTQEPTLDSSTEHNTDLAAQEDPLPDRSGVPETPLSDPSSPETRTTPEPTTQPQPCRSRAECDELAHCFIEKGQTRGLCQRVCRPLDTPQKDGCKCMPGWEWYQNRCRQLCPTDMLRRKDEVCTPDLGTLYPNEWHQGHDGHPQWACPQGWKQDKQDKCQIWLRKDGPLPTIPAPPRPTVGPQKQCGNDKWDATYWTSLTAAQRGTFQRVYVDATATAVGDGSLASPFQSLTNAIASAKTKSVLLLAPGDYAWGQTIEKELHLVGRCAADVRIVAGIKLESVGLKLNHDGIVLEGLSLIGRGVDTSTAVVVEALGGEVTLRELLISNTAHRGISLYDTNAIIERCELKDTGATGQESSAIFARRKPAATQRLIVRNNNIHHNRLHGIRLQGLQTVHVIDNIFQANGQDKRWFSSVGSFNQVTTHLLVKGNRFLNNSGGILVGESGKVEILGNEILQTKPLAPEFATAGLAIEKNQGPILVQHNHINENGWQGLFVHTAGDVRVEQNAFKNNGTHDPTFGRGVEIHKASGDILVTSNLIYQNRSQGIKVSEASKLVEIHQNLVQANGLNTSSDPQIESTAMGIYVHNSKTAAITIAQNLVEGNGEGIRVRVAASATVVANWVKSNGIQTRAGNGITLIELTQSSRVVQNWIEKNTKSGLVLLDFGPMHVQSNIIRDHGIDATNNGHGISASSTARASDPPLPKTDLAVIANEISHNIAIGTLASVPQALFQHNIYRANGSKDPDGGGLHIQKSSHIRAIGNLSENNSIGGSIDAGAQDGVIEYHSNVWTNNKQAGLVVTRNRAAISIKHELFSHNAGRHLIILNNFTSVLVESSGFANAKPADALPKRGFPQTKGDGIHVGAVGLTRWVFAEKKYDYACSYTKSLPTVTHQGKLYIMRKILVPHPLDPCQEWSYNAQYRTKDQREAEARCQKCYKQGKGCRWIWIDFSAKDKPPPPEGTYISDGRWRQQTGDDAIVCVPLNELDTCRKPHKMDDPPVLTTNGDYFVSGQCKQLPKGTDPCEHKELLYCKEEEDKKNGYCARFLNEGASLDKATATCLQWGNNPFAKATLTQSCRPDVVENAAYKCPDGQQCIRSAFQTLAQNVHPSPARLLGNVFWDNPGLDLLFGMAGFVTVSENRFLFCLPDKDNTGCKPKVTFQRKATVVEGELVFSWVEKPLEAGITIVWQNPSPYISSDDRYTSSYFGTDMDRSLQGRQLLARPDLCGELF